MFSVHFTHLMVLSVSGLIFFYYPFAYFVRYLFLFRKQNSLLVIEYNFNFAICAMFICKQGNATMATSSDEHIRARFRYRSFTLDFIRFVGFFFNFFGCLCLVLNQIKLLDLPGFLWNFFIHSLGAQFTIYIVATCSNYYTE